MTPHTASYFTLDAFLSALWRQFDGKSKDPLARLFIGTGDPLPQHAEFKTEGLAGYIAHALDRQVQDGNMNDIAANRDSLTVNEIRELAGEFFKDPLVAARLHRRYANPEERQKIINFAAGAGFNALTHEWDVIAGPVPQPAFVLSADLSQAEENHPSVSMKEKAASFFTECKSAVTSLWYNFLNRCFHNSPIDRVNRKFMELYDRGDAYWKPTMADALRKPCRTSAQALYVAATYGFETELDELIAQGVDPNGPVKWGYFDNCIALSSAAHQNTSIVVKLLKAGADPNIGEGENAPLDAAAENDNLEMVQMFLDAGLKIPADPSPLRSAIISGGTKLLPLLLAAGIDPNEGIFTAVRRGAVPALRLLMAAGADPQRRNEKGQTLLEALKETIARDKIEEMRGILTGTISDPEDAAMRLRGNLADNAPVGSAATGDAVESVVRHNYRPPGIGEQILITGRAPGVRLHHARRGGDFSPDL